MRTARLVAVLILSAASVRAASERAIAMPDATLEQLAEVSVAGPAIPHLHLRSRSFSIGEIAMPEAFTEAPAAIAAPAVGAKFQDDSDPSNIYPPDAGGALSANYVVAVDNKAVSVRNRAGAQLQRTTINQFWHDPNFPDGTLYDSRISYDVANDRWVIAALYDRGSGNQSNLMFAASDSGDPTGTWHRYHLRVDATNATSADFTRMALTAQTVVATANIYVSGAGDPSNAAIYVIAKSALYAGGANPAVNVANTAKNVVDIAPVATFDAGDSRVWVVSSKAAGLTVIDASNGIATTQHYPAPVAMLDDYVTNFGQQLGSSVLMDTGDIVPQYGLIRNNTLWVVQTYEPASGAARSAIGTWHIDLTTNTPRFFTIDDPTGATTYAFPSIAVNRNGAALMAYAQYNAAYYPSSAFTYLDASGNASASSFLRQGDSFYGIDRWADFTTAVVDPLDDTGFWTIQVLPLKQTPLSQQVWSTWWFNVPLTTASSKHRAARH